VLNSKYALVESEIGTVGCLDSPWWRKIERLEKGVEGAISKHSSGKYTVKSAYRLLMSDFVRTGEKFNQIILHAISPLKVVLFAWKMIRNWLPIKNNIVKHGIIGVNSDLCSKGVD